MDKKMEINENKILNWQMSGKYSGYYDAYDESFKYPHINDSNYIWWEDGNFERTLVVNKNTGAVTLFKNKPNKDDKFIWEFEEVDVEETIKLNKILNTKA